MNLPNRLTLARIILIPVFMAFLLLQVPKGHTLFPHQEIVAAIIFILASATDGLDGYIARKRHQVTNLGKFMDPLADKLLVSAALVSLVELGEVNAWIAWIVLAREFAVTGLRAIAAVDRVVISASKLGKIKTITQVVAISAILLNDWPLSLIGLHIGQPLLYVAVFFTIISGLDYMLKSRKLLHK
ncbi:CDP-diacylglycerol--glycerol-3-phosphate 3-phosphatidyltransferase [Desulfosporosinus acidiphilus SJ4]|uniref:CDP-diacylglycerol--glycerol-3-phosphate 3-phosphatidyltransferase n=1 Tax=Desulfosporosinus acidiphilus (strain DSM 22704 / JCM 16185 / SJ4) TaxID=646529 RepID=I4D8J4_DESAJ|nr:CDP-diacylglycerol--glycerol-3-phosphate 3-phosphatidyltransferase [Desulfosporosinus acidiphilus]AFM42118.1 CDP-diacylglycerol--glycerol-3-phosphate 3-phosphatidyltransferase [Desulfosporosinus acidiphilus SJ4]